ncbi:MAG: sialidase family protein [Candidatus Kapabacteria bacterium]|nr:sialidase family protein [Candidatus Kapabacteria bacterium]
MKYILIVWLLLNGIIANAQWEADFKLSTNEGSASLNENMGQCIATNGNDIHVVWWDANKNGSPIFYKKSSDRGVNWIADKRLSGTPGKADFPSVAVANGIIYVACRDSAIGSALSSYYRSTDGGNTFEPIVSLGYYYWWPSITASDANVFMALNDSHPGNTEVYCRRSTNYGINWDGSIQISNDTNRSEDPSIAAGGDYVHLAWNDKRTGKMETFYRRSTDNGLTWGIETNMSGGSGTYSYCPMVAVNGSYVDVVWAGGSCIRHRYSSNYGATWSNVDSLVNGYAVYYPSILRDGLNVHLICFSFNDGLLYCKSTDGGKSWTSPSVIVSGASHPAFPFIGVTRDILHLIWTDQRDGHKAIYYKRNPTGNYHAPTNSIQVSFIPTIISAGSKINIPFQATGAFSAANIFSVQLSDTIGNFTNPTVIGSINSNMSSSINAVFPKSLAYGSAYKIRIISSDPFFIGANYDSSLTINPLPVPVITGLNTICENSTGTYISSNIPNHQFKWGVSGGIIIGADNQNSVNIKWYSAGKGTVTLIEIITSTGCTDSVTKIINIEAKPSPKIVGNKNVCKGEIISYSTLKINSHIYQWTDDLGKDISNGFENFTWIKWTTPLGKRKIFVLETDTISSCSDTSSFEIMVLPAPDAKITGKISVCENELVDYSVPSDSGYNYYWTISGGNILNNPNQASIQVQWLAAPSGTIGTSVKNKSTFCSSSNDQIIQINKTPKPKIVGSDKAINYSIEKYSVIPDALSGFKWNVTGGSFIGPDNLPDVNVKWSNVATGTVSVLQTTNNNCIGNCFFPVHLITSVNELMADDIPNFIVTSNAEQVQVELYLDKNIEIKLEIVDLNGITLKTLFNGTTTEGKHDYYWNFNEKNPIFVKNGTYFVVLKNVNKVLAKKVLILN